MILTKEQIKRFHEAAKPLIKWLNEENFHPHIKVIVEQDSAEFLEGSASIKTTEFLRD